MNLTTDLWIPIVWNSGETGQVSLRDAFLRGHEIRDLAVRPHERIALMRLLICVAQAALDGPKDRADWKTCRDRIAKETDRYLKKWGFAFELLGPGPRFLQMKGITPTETSGEGNDIAKLDLDLASGNMSSLFDTAGGSDRSFTPARVALILLTFQCFSPGGLLSECLWNGQRTKKAGNETGPCLADRMVHTFVLDRANLLDQVQSNLVAQDVLASIGWGKPVWEMMPKGCNTDTPEVANALATHLGRLVPISRAIWIGNDLKSVIWGCGLEYLPFDKCAWRDPFATICADKYEEGVRKPLAVSTDRALWRELHAITTVRTSEERNAIGGPFPLTHFDKMAHACDVWTGGLVVKQKSKILEAVESVFHVPAGMFVDTGRALYQDGVAFSDRRARQLTHAVVVYRQELKDELDRKETRKRGMEVKRKAAAHYWTAVEQEVRQLLTVVENPALLGFDLTKPQWKTTAWGRSISRAAREAYDLACPHATPRQYKAYAFGLQALFAQPPAGSDDSETETTTEE